MATNVDLIWNEFEQMRTKPPVMNPMPPASPTNVLTQVQSVNAGAKPVVQPVHAEPEVQPVQQTPSSPAKPLSQLDLEIQQMQTAPDLVPQAPATPPALKPAEGFGEANYNAYKRTAQASMQMYYVVGAMGGATDTAAEMIAESRRIMDKYPASQEYQNFMQDKSIKSNLKRIATHPVDILGQLFTESMVGYGMTTYPSAVIGGATGAAAGAAIPVAGETVVPSLVGEVVGSAAGTALGSAMQDASSEFLDYLDQNGINTRDAEQLKKAFADPELMRTARNYALKHGIPVGILDGVSAGVAGKLVRAARKAGAPLIKQAGAMAVEDLIIQPALGGAGEAGGQILARGEITDSAAILAEIVGEIPVGAVQTVRGVKAEEHFQNKVKPKIDKAIADRFGIPVEFIADSSLARDLSEQKTKEGQQRVWNAFVEENKEELSNFVQERMIEQLSALEAPTNESKAETGSPQTETPGTLQRPSLEEAQTAIDGVISKTSRLAPGQWKAADTPNRPDAKAAESAAWLFGRKVVWFSDTSQTGSFKNGTIDGDTIFINRDTERPALVVLSHEITHGMELDASTSPETAELYNKLTNAIFAASTEEQREAFRQSLSSIRQDAAVDDATLRSEFIANVVQEQGANPAFWEAVAKDDPNVLQLVMRAIERIIAMMKTAVGIPGIETPDSAEKFLTQSNLQEVHKTITEVFSEYSQIKSAQARRQAQTEGGASEALQAPLGPNGEPAFSESLANLKQRMLNRGIPIQAVERFEKAGRLQDARDLAEDKLAVQKELFGGQETPFNLQQEIDQVRKEPENAGGIRQDEGQLLPGLSEQEGKGAAETGKRKGGAPLQLASQERLFSESRRARRIALKQDYNIIDAVSELGGIAVPNTRFKGEREKATVKEKFGHGEYDSVFALREELQQAIKNATGAEKARLRALRERIFNTESGMKPDKLAQNLTSGQQEGMTEARAGFISNEGDVEEMVSELRKQIFAGPDVTQEQLDAMEDVRAQEEAEAYFEEQLKHRAEVGLPIDKYLTENASLEILKKYADYGKSPDKPMQIDGVPAYRDKQGKYWLKRTDGAWVPASAAAETLIQRWQDAQMSESEAIEAENASGAIEKTGRPDTRTAQISPEGTPTAQGEVPFSEEVRKANGIGLVTDAGEFKYREAPAGVSPARMLHSKEFASDSILGDHFRVINGQVVWDYAPTPIARETTTEELKSRYGFAPIHSDVIGRLIPFSESERGSLQQMVDQTPAAGERLHKTAQQIIERDSPRYDATFKNFMREQFVKPEALEETRARGVKLMNDMTLAQAAYGFDNPNIVEPRDAGAVGAAVWNTVKEAVNSAPDETTRRAMLDLQVDVTKRYLNWASETGRNLSTVRMIHQELYADPDYFLAYATKAVEDQNAGKLVPGQTVDEWTKKLSKEFVGAQEEAMAALQKQIADIDAKLQEQKAQRQKTEEYAAAIVSENERIAEESLRRLQRSQTARAELEQIDRETAANLNALTGIDISSILGMEPGAPMSESPGAEEQPAFTDTIKTALIAKIASALNTRKLDTKTEMALRQAFEAKYGDTVSEAWPEIMDRARIARRGINEEMEVRLLGQKKPKKSAAQQKAVQDNRKALTAVSQGIESGDLVLVPQARKQTAPTMTPEEEAKIWADLEEAMRTGGWRQLVLGAFAERNQITAEQLDKALQTLRQRPDSLQAWAQANGITADQGQVILDNLTKLQNQVGGTLGEWFANNPRRVATQADIDALRKAWTEAKTNAQRTELERWAKEAGITPADLDKLFAGATWQNIRAEIAYNLLTPSDTTTRPPETAIQRLKRQEAYARRAGLIPAMLKEAFGMTLSQAIREYGNSLSSVRQTLLEYIVAKTGMNAAEAAKFAFKYNQVFQETFAKKQEALRKQAQNRKTVSALDKIFNKIQSKGWQYDAIRNAFAEAWGIKVITPEIAAQLQTMAENVRNTERDFGRDSNQARKARHDAVMEMAKLNNYSVGDIVRTMVMSNLLSGPHTYAFNAAANLTLQAMTTAEEIQRLVGKAVKNMGKLNFSAAGSDLGMIAKILQYQSQGWFVGSSDFAYTLLTGEAPRSELEKYGDDPSKVNPAEVLPMFKGSKLNPLRLVKYPRRILAGSDMLSRMALQEMKASLIAYEVAQREGLSGSAALERVSELMGYTSLKSDFSWKQAQKNAIDAGLKPNTYEYKAFVNNELRQMYENLVQDRPAEMKHGIFDETGAQKVMDPFLYAAKNTFNDPEPPGIFGLLHRMVTPYKKNPVVWTLFMFSRIAANVIHVSAEFSPLGFVTAMTGKEFTGKTKEAFRTLSPDERATKTLRALNGTTIGLAALMWAMRAYTEWEKDKDKDKKEPKFQITANGPRDPGLRKLWLQNHKPFSITYQDDSGRTWNIRYAWTPVGIPLATVGAYMDWKRWNKPKDEIEDPTAAIAMALFTGTAKYAMQQAPVQTLSQWLRAFSESDDQNAMRAFKTLAGQSVGYVIPNAIRQIDKFFDPTIYNDRKFLQAIVKEVPAWRGSLSPRRNIFGDPVSQDPLARFYEQHEPDHEAEFLASHKTVRPPERNTFFWHYNKKLGQYGVRYLDDDEFDFYLKAFGTNLRREIKNVRQVTAGADETAIEDQISKARERANNLAMSDVYNKYGLLKANENTAKRIIQETKP